MVTVALLQTGMAVIGAAFLASNQNQVSVRTEESSVKQGVPGK